MAYIKNHGTIDVIGIRFANSEERAIFFGHRPVGPKVIPSPSADPDALEALGWIEAGMPDGKIGYGADAPRLTPEQLTEFEPATCVATGKRRPA